MKVPERQSCASALPFVIPCCPPPCVSPWPQLDNFFPGLPSLKPHFPKTIFTFFPSAMRLTSSFDSVTLSEWLHLVTQAADTQLKKKVVVKKKELDRMRHILHVSFSVLFPAVFFCDVERIRPDKLSTFLSLQLTSLGNFYTDGSLCLRDKEKVLLSLTVCVRVDLEA